MSIMMSKVKRRILLFPSICLVLSSCASYGPPLEPIDRGFGQGFTLVSNGNISEPLQAIAVANEVLTENGFTTSVDASTYRIRTGSKYLGYLTWAGVYEEWEVSYSLEIQIVPNSSTGIFWKIIPIVRGARSLAQPRYFSPYDFEEIESEISILQRQLSRALSVAV